MGTGTFLAEIIDIVSEEVGDEEDPLNVPATLRQLVRRLAGFEKHVAPFTVAEFQIHESLRSHGAEIPVEEIRFLNDTLDDPRGDQLPLGGWYKALEKNRERANKFKVENPVLVAIGNPPFATRSKGAAPWIEAKGHGGTFRPALDDFRLEGNGKHEYVLSDLFVYFWRWATWKVFDAHPTQQPQGIVAFVSPASFTQGPGFAGMRRYLRQTADEGWIIDLTPEGHRSDVGSRLFPGVRNELCIAIFIRHGNSKSATPAHMRYASLAGTRDAKLAALETSDISTLRWINCPSGWSEEFRPVDEVEARADWPTLGELMPWHAPGIKPNRTWVYAPDPDTLRKRWDILVGAQPQDKANLFKETESSNLIRIPPGLPHQKQFACSFAEEGGPCPAPVRISLRSFDRQWTIPDARLHHRPSPTLWMASGRQQLFVTEQHAHPITSGPALTFTALIPDMHHYNARGGRVLPLFRDDAGEDPNLAPKLLEVLGRNLGRHIFPEDFLAYVAGVAAHPGYVDRLGGPVRGGVKVPLTRNPELWLRMVRLGSRVLWLHTFGERYVNASAGRPAKIPRLEPHRRPQVLAPIPDGHRPDRFEYDDNLETLRIGSGVIGRLPPDIWNYQVSGMRVLPKWIGYRLRIRKGRRSSALDDVWAGGWPANLTSELLNLITVLSRCRDIEPAQDATLVEVLNGPLLTRSMLLSDGVLPIPPSRTKPRQDSRDERLPLPW